MIDVERVDYVRVPATDIEEAKRFYGEVLGLRESPNSPGDDSIEYERPPFAPSPAGLALRVSDVDAMRAEFEARGVDLDGETIETSVCKQARFEDPDGNSLMLNRRYDV